MQCIYLKASWIHPWLISLRSWRFAPFEAIFLQKPNGFATCNCSFAKYKWTVLYIILSKIFDKCNKTKLDLWLHRKIHRWIRKYSGLSWSPLPSISNICLSKTKTLLIWTFMWLSSCFFLFISNTFCLESFSMSNKYFGP